MKICLYDSGLGVLPFIKVILRKNLGNDYYLYLDNKNFPYGNKSEKELVKILKDNLIELEKYQFDLILILCNTMSYIYHISDLHLANIKCILDLNLSNLNKEKLLCTSYLSNKIENTLDGQSLATFIENENIVDIINFINLLHDKVLLGCTHYHLIKNILPLYNKKFTSIEEKIFDNIPFMNKVNIYVLKKDYPLIRKYIKNVINLY